MRDLEAIRAEVKELRTLRWQMRDSLIVRDWFEALQEQRCVALELKCQKIQQSLDESISREREGTSYEFLKMELAKLNENNERLQEQLKLVEKDKTESVSELLTSMDKLEEEKIDLVKVIVIVTLATGNLPSFLSVCLCLSRLTVKV
jgi:hypothetical protein